MEIIIYADESDKKGEYYSNFYGGALVASTDITECIQRLNDVKKLNNLNGEIKWSKITENYLSKYKSVMAVFFNLIAEDKIKVRIMFTDNRYVATNLSKQQREESYFILYYQFFKHAFGLRYIDSQYCDLPINCRINLDDLPDTIEKAKKFKKFLECLSYNKFLKGKIIVKMDQIAEVKSHDHVILQCLDIVLGSMNFRLNQRHKIKLEDSGFRGKRTVAKDNLYQYINQRIREIYPNFNIGVSTGRIEGSQTWFHPYRHWVFKPKEHEYDKND